MPLRNHPSYPQVNRLMSEDIRLDALRAWLARVSPAPVSSLAPASADASFRRYFRVTLSDDVALPIHGKRVRTLIAMDAPPPHENCAPFVAVAALLAEAGINAPAVLADDVARGFLLLTDLGEQTYLGALTHADAPQLYRDACDVLVRWQRASRQDVLPNYDEALLRRELDLFSDWYVARHLGYVLDATQRATPEPCSARSPRQQPGASEGLRSPRLSLAQSDGH